MSTIPQDHAGARIMRAVFSIYVFALVLALYTGTHDPAGPIKTLITDLTLVVLAVTGLATVLLGGPAPRFKAPLSLFMGASIALYLLAALFSDHPAHGLAHTRHFITLAMLLLFASQAYRQPAQAYPLLACMVAAVTISSCYGLYQATGLPDPFPWSSTELEEYRGLPATYANPNFAGHTLVIALLITVFMALRNPWYLAPALIMVTHLYYTEVRAAPLALVGAALLVVVTLLLRPGIRQPVRLATTVLIITGLLGAGAAVGAATMHYQRHGALLPLDSSLLLRWNGYYSAGRMMGARPALGFGPGAYAIENAAYWTPYEQQWFATAGKKNMHVHNELMETAIDAGAAAAAVLLAIFLFALLRSLAMTRSEDPRRSHLGLLVAACTGAVFIDALFGFNLRVPVSSTLFFLLLGILTGITVCPPVPRRAVRAAGCAALAALACVNAYAGVRFFRVETYYQAAESARFRMTYYREAGNREQAEHNQRLAYGSLERGHRLAPWDRRFHTYLAYFDLQSGAYGRALERTEYVARPGATDVRALAQRAGAYLGRAQNALENQPEQVDKNLASAEAVLARLGELCAPLPAHSEMRGRVHTMRALHREQQGRDAREDWAAAADAYAQAVVQGADNRASLQRRAALAYHAAGNTAEAKRAFRLAAESDPADAELWTHFHRLASETNDYKALVDALLRARARLRDQTPPPKEAIVDVAWHLGVVYREQARNERARQALASGIATAPDAMRLWGEYMLTLPSAERVAGLCDQVAAVSSNAPGESDGGALAILRCLCNAKDDDLAECAARLAAFVHQRAETMAAQTIARELSWMADFAVDVMNATQLPAATQGAVLFHLGEVFLVSQRFENADQCLAAASSKLPEDMRPMAQARRSEVLAQSGRAEEALALASTAVQARREPIVQHMYARRLAEAGRLDEARFEYSTLVNRVSRRYRYYGALVRENAQLKEKAP
ncbi:MAG: O-antigen ligase family protein [Candidatus Hydrogenedentota bacterium]